jgi:hypothetical protein
LFSTETEGPALSPPRFVSEPFTLVAVEGTFEYSLRVRVEGFPLPVVTWLKDGQDIDLSPDFLVFFNNGLCEVALLGPIRRFHQGTYTAVASNTQGTAQIDVRLKVQPQNSE